MWDVSARYGIRGGTTDEYSDVFFWVVFWLAFVSGAFILIVRTPDWWYWLVLGVAVWWVAGFLLARRLWPDAPLRVKLVDAFLAPLSVLWFAAFVIPQLGGARVLRKLRREVGRIGADAVRVAGPWDGKVDVYDVLPGTTNHGWSGSADLALDRLRSVRDNAGRDGLWSAFPDLTSHPYLSLNAELERIAGPGKRAPVLYVFRGVGGSDPLEILEGWDEEDGVPPPDPAWTWSGSGEDALERLRRVPDGSGRNGLWDAFPDRTASR